MYCATGICWNCCSLCWSDGYISTNVVVIYFALRSGRAQTVLTLVDGRFYCIGKYPGLSFMIQVSFMICIWFFTVSFCVGLVICRICLAQKHHNCTSCWYQVMYASLVPVSLFWHPSMFTILIHMWITSVLKTAEKSHSSAIKML
jgi:hypothetical protein